MNLWLRYQAWRYGICYKHKLVKDVYSNEFGPFLECPECNLDNISKRQNQAYKGADTRDRIICKLKK